MMTQPRPLSFGLQQVQAKACFTLTLFSLGLLPVSLVVSWLANGSVLVTFVAGILLVGTAFAGRRAAPATGRILVALALVGQVAVLTGSMSGHSWQIDMHMMFFAVLATLVAMIDIWAVLIGAGAIVLHHLGLTLVLPTLIYPSVDLIPNIGRTLIHGGIVAIEVVALVGTILRIRQLDMEASENLEQMQAISSESDNARAAAENAMISAQSAQQEAELAGKALEELRRAEAERARSDAVARDQVHKAAAAQAQQQASDAAEQAAVMEVLRAALKTVSQGDFTRTIRQSLPAGYEDLRHDFNQMVESLNQTIQTALEHTGTIDGETGSISAAAVDLSGRAERQASSMEETAAALEEITASVRSAADRANAARGKSQTASQSAETGRAVVDSAMQTMKRIEESSEKISRITAVIDDISFQTNLLALNAGVEAARVGEAGRGFAVVASEVRALAQRSADAAREINGLIGESGALVKQGVARVEETGQALLVILEQVKQITADVADIANSTTEQSKGITEVNRSMQGLGQLTQQIAAMFEETTAATVALERETGQLRDVLGQFQTGTADSGKWSAANAA